MSNSEEDGNEEFDVDNLEIDGVNALEICLVSLRNSANCRTALIFVS